MEGSMSYEFDRFTERARNVLTLAQEEAQRLHHNYIGTEHLVLGLVREGDGIAARVLNNMGIHLPKVRSAVEFIIGRGDTKVGTEIGLTVRAKQVIEFAVLEARQLGHPYIGTEHLLLGLLRLGDGIGAGVLESLGVSLEKARANVLRVIPPVVSPTPLCNPTKEQVDNLIRNMEIMVTRLKKISAAMSAQAEVQPTLGINPEDEKRLRDPGNDIP